MPRPQRAPIPDQRRRKVVAELFKLGPTASLELKAQCLIQHFDVEVLQEILGWLDPILIPPMNVRGADSSAVPRSGAEVVALSALRDFGGIVEIFESTIPELRTLKERCFAVILEKWDGVTQWIIHFLQSDSLRHPIREIHFHAILGAPCSIMIATEVEPFKDELLDRTVDALTTSFCLVDSDTNKHISIAQVIHPGCQISSVFLNFLEANPSVRYQVSMMLKHGSRGKRKALISALKGRAQQAIDVPLYNAESSIIKASTTLLAVCSIVTYLTRWSLDELLSHKIYYECALVVSTLSQRAGDAKITNTVFWTRVACCITTIVTHAAMNASQDPVHIIGQVVDGRIVRSAFQCLLHVDKLAPEEICTKEVLRNLLQFLPVQSVYASAAMDEYAIAELFTASIPRRLSDEARQLQESLVQGLSWGRIAFDDKRASIVCSNLQHAQRTGAEEKEIVTKTCGRCQYVYYCSAACQQEDWIAFHSKECAMISMACDMGNAPRPSFRRRRDQLTYIQAIANANLPPPFVLKRGAIQQRYSPTERLASPNHPSYPPDLSIAILDAGGAFGRSGFAPRFSLNDHWQACRQYISDESMSNARAEACVRDLQRRLSSVVLVEGIFSLNRDEIMFVLAKLEYSPHAPPGRKYDITGHVFRSARDHGSESE